MYVYMLFAVMRIHVTYIYVGNTGFYLTNTGSVYISHDGGLTWIQVCKCYIRTYNLSDTDLFRITCTVWPKN